MYTKKHFEATAKILNTHRKYALEQTYEEQLVRSFADYFAADNGRFNRQQFYNACGLEYIGQ